VQFYRHRAGLPTILKVQKGQCAFRAFRSTILLCFSRPRLLLSSQHSALTSFSAILHERFCLSRSTVGLCDPACRCNSEYFPQIFWAHLGLWSVREQLSRSFTTVVHDSLTPSSASAAHSLFAKFLVLVLGQSKNIYSLHPIPSNMQPSIPAVLFCPRSNYHVPSQLLAANCFSLHYT
jgi:hypothetical protein